MANFLEKYFSIGYKNILIKKSLIHLKEKNHQNVSIMFFKNLGKFLKNIDILFSNNKKYLYIF
jgi:hypothetical protein